MKAFLKEFHISKAAAGRYFGVHRNTIAAWCDNTPKSVNVFIEMLRGNLARTNKEGLANEAAIEVIRNA